MYEKFTLWVSIAVWDGQLEVDRPFFGPTKSSSNYFGCSFFDDQVKSIETQIIGNDLHRHCCVRLYGPSAF